MTHDQGEVLKRFFELRETTKWTSLFSGDTAVRWFSPPGRFGKVAANHLYFTVGETQRGKACRPKLTERLERVVTDHGIRPSEELEPSTDTRTGTPREKGKYYIRFNLEGVGPSTLRSIIGRAMEEVRECAAAGDDGIANTPAQVDLARPHDTLRPVSLDEERFRKAHDEFLAFVRGKDEMGTSFDDLRRPFEEHPFFLATEVHYKREARAFAYTVLPPRGEWHTWLDEPGRLLNGLYQASFKTTNLLVVKYGDEDNSASPVYQTLNRSELEQIELERELALLFDGPTEPDAFGPRFDRLAGFIRDRRLGCKWDFLAYLAFLADDARYFPVKSSHFQDLLRFYGSDERFAGRVTWDRYQTMLRLAAWIREMLPERYGTPTALELQSYMWVVIYGVLPHLPGAPRRKRANNLQPKDFAEEQKRRRARAANAQDVGLLGEKHCFDHEVARLAAVGREDLARRVRLISFEDESAGYDLLTFDEDGRERHVEVKATSCQQRSGRSFWLSQNECERAELDPSWELWRVWDVRGTGVIEELGNVVAVVPEDWRREVASWRYSKRTDH